MADEKPVHPNELARLARMERHQPLIEEQKRLLLDTQARINLAKVAARADELPDKKP